MNKILVLLLLSFPITLFSQNDCKKYEDEYIPIDLADAISFFECNWSDEDLIGFKKQGRRNCYYGITFWNRYVN